MWQFITEYWAGWLCALIGGAILAAIPKISLPLRGVGDYYVDRLQV